VARFFAIVLLLTAALVLVIEGGLAPRVRTDAPRPVVRTGNPIVAENQKAGTSDWRIPDTKITGGQLQGFASRTSVPPNGHISLYVTSNYPTYNVDIYRMGWYDGTGGRLVYSRHGLRGHKQPDPTIDPETRMVEADWSRSLTLKVSDDWTTGTYLVKLSTPEGRGSYIPFVVREGKERAPIVFQSSVTTWQAYNIWGGHSLYYGIGEHGGETTALRSEVVSFDRPYGYGVGAADYFGLEFPLVQWLERNGYDVGYATDIDTHEDPLLLAGRRAFLSLGHDEYWSTAMRDHVEDAIKAGVNMAFFGANAMYRHIRFERSPLGRDRREVNYRSTKDPIFDTDRSETTVQWRDWPLDRPEDAVLGAMYECVPAHGDAIVYDPLSWLFDGTDLVIGDEISGIVGDEYDRVFPDDTHPKRLWVLFRSPVTCGGASSVQDTTFARFPSGAGVFDAGTSRFMCVFSGCEDAPSDTRMQRLIKNLLDSYLAPHAPSFEPDPLPFTTNNRHVIVQQEQSTIPSRTFEPVPTAAPARTPTAPEPLPSSEPEPTPRHLIL
jgi:hypothetical protein